MRTLSAGWFYCKLLLTNIWFISWYTLNLHFSSRIFLLAASLCVYTVLLIVFHTFAWQTTVFTRPIYSPKLIIDRLQQSSLESQVKIYERIALQKHEQLLTSLLTTQPTHRDALINLALLKYTTGQTAEAARYMNLARQLDPNHPFLIQF